MQGLENCGEEPDVLQWEVTEGFQVKEGLDLIYTLKDLFGCCVEKRLSRCREEIRGSIKGLIQLPQQQTMVVAEIDR